MADPLLAALRSVGRQTTRTAPVVNKAVRRRVARTTRPVYGPPVPANVAEKNDLARRIRQMEDASLTRYAARKAGKSSDVRSSGPANLNPLLAARSGGGNIFSNFGGDIIDSVTAIPSLVMLGAKNVGAVGLAPVAGLSKLGVPGTGFAESYIGDVAELDKATAQGVARDIQTRWGPLAEALGPDVVKLLISQSMQQASGSKSGAYGPAPAASGSQMTKHLGEFRHQVYEHPGLFALEAAAIASAGGSLTASGARALSRALPEGSRAARVAAAIGEKSILPAGARVAGGRLSTGSRYRPPKVLEVSMGPNSARGKKGPATAKVEIPQRPYSPNPGTRAVQKKVLEPVARSIQAKIDAHIEAKGGGALSKLGTEARFRRRSADAARDLRLSEEGIRDKALRQRGDDFIRAAAALDREGTAPLRLGKGAKWTPAQVDAALFLHAQDLLDVPGKTVQQARNDVVTFMQAGNKRINDAGLKDEFSLNTIRAIEQVPDELLSLGPDAPKSLVKAVEEYRALSRESTKIRQAAGTVSPEAAIAAPKRFAQMVHEGVRFDYKTDTWTSPRNPYSTIGKRAVYVPHEAVDPLTAGKAGQSGTAFARMTNKRDKQSHGTLASTGNISLSRGLPLKAMEKALTDLRHPDFVKEFYDTFAFHNKDASGRLYRTTGKRAALAMQADPKNVTLISAKSLDDAIAASKLLDEGELPDMAKLIVYEGKDSLPVVSALSKEERKQLVAVPKAAIDALRSGWTGTKPLAYYDTPLQLWRKGILSLAPRWYLNNAFGNTLQYGLLTGGDLRAILQARRSALGEVVPERVGSSTVVQDTMRGARASTSKMGKRYDAVTHAGLSFNNKMESLIHRAAYISRGKRLLKNEGVNIRRMTPDQLEQALHDMPNELKVQALRDTELFLGDYLRLKPAERAIMRRIFPFYSWMRVIGKLMGSMPFRTPKRTAVTALISRAANEQMNPLDLAERIIGNRGMLHFGPFAQRTAGINPFFTPAAIVKAISNRDPTELSAALVSNLSPIGLKQLAQWVSGTNWSGAPITAPPGYGDSYQVYGGPLMRDDPTTGVSDYYKPGVPIEEQLLQMVPIVPQITRSVASGTRQPYDVTTTPEILKYRLGLGGDPGELFRPERDRAVSPIPYLSPFLGYAGVNLQRYDRKQHIRDIQLAEQRRRQAKIATKIKKAKAR